jgi:hypothetical protein
LLAADRRGECDKGQLVQCRIAATFADGVLTCAKR